jgi:hypothetical protein
MKILAETANAVLIQQPSLLTPKPIFRTQNVDGSIRSLSIPDKNCGDE